MTVTNRHSWTEFKVTGNPGGDYPPYVFTYRSDDPRWPSAEEAEDHARRLTQTAQTWETPAVLLKRECTLYSDEWEAADDGD